MNRREFLSVLALASASGFPLTSSIARAESLAKNYYQPKVFGNVSLLHITDCHAQLLPIYFREPSVNIGVADMSNRLPHLVGEQLLKQTGLTPGSREAYAFSNLDFSSAARMYGKVGGFAHLATLVKQLKADRPGALLLDGGDTWQGSATSLWTKAQDMVDASKLLGVDVMTLHWESTYGDARVKEIEEKDFQGKIDIVAQNIRTADFEDPVFKPYVLREINGVSVAIIGQAFPYTPIANPRYFTPNWTFGIREEDLQATVEKVRSAGAKAVVLLSHNGMDVDIKLASRVVGIDVILGGHTHDGVAQPIAVSNKGGTTFVTNAGSNGKFLALLELDVRDGRVRDLQYNLMPVFSEMIPADPEMQAYIDKVRAPFLAKLNEPLAVSEGLLYRRGNFNGSWDQLILDALLQEKNAEIAFSPGFRWGTSILPGDTITMERLLDQTAITYPYTTVSELSGEMIKTILEDVCDNLFNADPYYQQGGDMVRVGGLQYRCQPNQSMGKRIDELRLNGKAIEASKTYRVAGWAPVAEAAATPDNEPIWDVIVRYLKQQKTVNTPKLNLPELLGVDGNSGLD